MKAARALVVAALVLVPAAASAARLAELVPERYTLSLRPGDGRGFSGHETLEGRLTAPTRVITLDSVELRIGEARVRAGDATVSARVGEGAATGTVTLTLPAAVDGEVQIELGWSGALADDLTGLFATGSGAGRALFTDFEPSEARRVFPCIDEPGKKARFALTVDVGADEEAVSNTPVVERVRLPDGRARVRFAETGPLPAYLVALAVGRFGVLHTTAGATPLGAVAPRGQLALARFALDTAAQLLPRLEAYFNRPFPFAKLDLVAVPAFAPGGMENAGAIFLRDDRMLVDPAHASPATIHAVTVLIAHELAHQWLGDLATPAAWNDLWLAEATATYVANEIVAAAHPDWQPWDELQPAIDEVMGEDELATTHAVRATDAGHAVFDGVVYTKGAALLRMLAGWIGSDAVRATLRHLVAERAWQSVSADDLWAALDGAGPGSDPIAATARAWFEERSHPTVEVGGECRDGRLTLSLRRARAAPAWTVPMSLRWTGGERSLLVGDAATVDIDGCPAWIEANAGRLGFYRVHYAAPLAAALADAAETALSPAERVGLLSDAWLDVRDGAPLAGYLSLATKLRGDRSPAVLDELGRRLAFAGAQLVTPAERSTFNRLVEELLAPAWAALGWTARGDDDDATRIARARVIELLGAVARAPGILREVERRMGAYLANPTSVDGALADTLTLLGAEVGDGGRYAAYLGRARHGHTPEERERFRAALARFEQPELLQRTVGLLLTGVIPPDALMRFAANVVDNERARPAAWRFLESHFDALERKAPRAGWLLPATQRLCDEGAARHIGRFLSLREPQAGMARAFAETSERIARCAALRRRTSVELAEWLHGRGVR